MFLIDFFRGAGRFFEKIGKAFYKVFSSEQAQKMLETVMVSILPEAVPIVEGIRSIIKSPTDATVPEIIDLYKQFGKTINAVVDDPVAKANDLLNLATQLLDEALPDKYETPLLHSAIELALSGLKSEGK